MFPQDVNFKYSFYKQVCLNELAFPLLKLKSSLVVGHSVLTHILSSGKPLKTAGAKSPQIPRAQLNDKRQGEDPAAVSALDGYLKGRAKCSFFGIHRVYFAL